MNGIDQFRPNRRAQLIDMLVQVGGLVGQAADFLHAGREREHLGDQAEKAAGFRAISLGRAAGAVRFERCAGLATCLADRDGVLEVIDFLRKVAARAVAAVEPDQILQNALPGLGQIQLGDEHVAFCAERFRRWLGRVLDLLIDLIDLRLNLDDALIGAGRRVGEVFTIRARRSAGGGGSRFLVGQIRRPSACRGKRQRKISSAFCRTVSRNNTSSELTVA